MKLIWCQICPPLNVPLEVSLGRKGRYGLEVTLWSLQDGTVLFGHCPVYIHTCNSFSWVITITSWWQCLSLESNFPFTPWLPSSQSPTYGVLLLFPRYSFCDGCKLVTDRDTSLWVSHSVQENMPKYFCPHSEGSTIMFQTYWKSTFARYPSSSSTYVTPVLLFILIKDSSFSLGKISAFLQRSFLPINLFTVFLLKLPFPHTVYL